jgi:hypothetical protein
MAGKKNKKRTNPRLLLLSKSLANATAVKGMPAMSATDAVVAFDCSPASVVVAIQIAGEQVIFSGHGAASFPKGNHTAVIRAKGGPGTTFTISATGAVMPAITKTIPASGSTGGLVPIQI